MDVGLGEHEVGGVDAVEGADVNQGALGVEDDDLIEVGGQGVVEHEGLPGDGVGWGKQVGKMPWGTRNGEGRKCGMRNDERRGCGVRAGTVKWRLCESNGGFRYR